MECNPPVFVLEQEGLLNFQFSCLQKQIEQTDQDGLVGAPILAHPVASAFNKMVEPKGGTRVGGKALILALLITQNSWRLIGFSGGSTVVGES
jgi:hypothetical protein